MHLIHIKTQWYMEEIGIMKHKGITVLALIVVLSGCTSASDNSGIDIDDLSEQYSSEIRIDENSSIKVDAEVIVPQNPHLGVYSASFMDYDIEKVKSILLKDTDSEPETTTIKNGDIIYTWIGETERLSIDKTSIWFESDLSDFILNVFLPPTRKGKTNADLFSECDLDFCSRSEAIENVVYALSNMGIDVDPIPEIYSFTQSDLQSVKDLYEKDTSFYPFDTSLYPKAVDKTDECYYMTFNAQYNNTPLYNELLIYKTINDFALGNPEINVIYSSEGIRYLYVMDYRREVRLTDSVTKVISAEEAAQKALNKYNEVVTTSEVNFDTIKLMYVYTPINSGGHGSDQSTVKMSPAWVCSGTIVKTEKSKTGGDDVTVSEKVTVLIDAQTGVEII